MTIQYLASGFKPSEHESPPITTRPGVPGNFNNFTLMTGLETERKRSIRIQLSTAFKVN